MSNLSCRFTAYPFHTEWAKKPVMCLMVLLFACGIVSANEQRSDRGTSVTVSASERTAAAEDLVNRVLRYFPVESKSPRSEQCNVQDATRLFVSRHFALEDKCTRLSESEGCSYYDYRKRDLSDLSGIDQRGITSYQVTYPGTTHLWAALSVRNAPESIFCWVGGAHVGRNPLAMTWSGDTGTKARKNNLILSESGVMEVESARIHNLHDIFLATSEKAGMHVNRSWITWNRDDFFEGYLHDIKVTDTLVDGTYTFISDPDGECDDVKKAGSHTIVIENSLIRLQRQPGPYARHTAKWHWKIAGGHNTLWKLDSCDWDDWPKFTLRNNVFLIEGPRTTRRALDTVDCRLALPGECGNPALPNLGECKNNLFLYTDYFRWRDKNSEPGPVPVPNGRFYNADNPQYLLNGTDCYQRLTDDRQSAGYADVAAIWASLRQRWIDWNTDPANVEVAVMKIPGVDTPVFANGSTVSLQNLQSGDCLNSNADGEISLRRCDGTSQQLFHIESFDDGKLMSAVLLKDSSARYLRTQAAAVLQNDDSDRKFEAAVFSQAPVDRFPDFTERWYILPLDDAAESFSIESDALGRSFLKQNGLQAEVQGFFDDGIDTALPQKRFSGGDDKALQWRIKRAPP